MKLQQIWNCDDESAERSFQTLECVLQVMTDFMLDNETAANLNCDDESAERSFQTLECVLQNDVHSSQIVHEPQDIPIEPSNFISIQKEKVLKNDNIANENQLRRQSKSEHAVPEKRRRLTELELG